MWLLGGNKVGGVYKVIIVSNPTTVRLTVGCVEVILGFRLLTILEVRAEPGPNSYKIIKK